jgi:hypothetical protein
VGTKKEELFDIGIELYDEELYKYALMVFDECIQHGIKKDTNYYKLANCLIKEIQKNQDKINNS